MSLNLTTYFLNHCNGLTCSLTTTAVWIRSLARGVEISHGKNGMVLPHAVISPMQGENERKFRPRFKPLFHVKNALDKIIDCVKNLSETFRYEWVSLRLFSDFISVSGSHNAYSRQGLPQVLPSDKPRMLEAGIKHEVPANQTNALTNSNPYTFQSLPPFACLMTWLIISQRRLPLQNTINDFNDVERYLNFITCHRGANNFDKSWSLQEINEDWHFTLGTSRSETWSKNARAIAKRARLACHILIQRQRFPGHLARLSSTLTDPVYSDLPAEQSKLRWRDNHCKACDIAPSLSKTHAQGGFYGIKMASTGGEKTFARCPHYVQSKGEVSQFRPASCPDCGKKTMRTLHLQIANRRKMFPGDFSATQKAFTAI